MKHLMIFGSKRWSLLSRAYNDSVFDRQIQLEEIAVCVRLKNNKTGGSDGIVGELLKYGGYGIIVIFCHLA